MIRAVGLLVGTIEVYEYIDKLNKGTLSKDNYY